MNIYVYVYRPERLIKSIHAGWSISSELVFLLFPLKGQTLQSGELSIECFKHNVAQVQFQFTVPLCEIKINEAHISCMLENPYMYADLQHYE